MPAATDQIYSDKLVEDLRAYVVDNPDATLTELTIFIMSFNYSQAEAQQVVGWIGNKFSELYGRPVSFDEIKESSISSLDIPVQEIDFTEAL